MHYRISYNINIYYHIYVSDNVNNGADALNVVNSNRCLRYDVQNNEIEYHAEHFDQLAGQNGIASIFMKSDQAPNLDPNNNGVVHVYVNNGSGNEAMEEMISLLNNVNGNDTPHIVKL